MQLLLCFLFLSRLFAYQDRFEILVTEHPSTRIGSKHLHWCTMCGADNCYEILRATIQIIEPYFDEIHIVDNGSTDKTPTLTQISPKITYTRIDNWDGNWTTCYMASIRNVCKGEWFLFNDSDERPSPKLLKEIRWLTQVGDKLGYNVFAIHSCHHTLDENGDVLTKIFNDFSKYNLLKREDMKISTFGSHSGFHPMNLSRMYMQDFNSELFYNHYKHESANGVSLFTQGFMFPTSFEELAPYSDEILKIREKLHIHQITQLFEMLNTKKIQQEFLDLIGKWKDKKGELGKIWNLIIRDGCTYQPTMQCNRECCDYR